MIDWDQAHRRVFQAAVVLQDTRLKKQNARHRSLVAIGRRESNPDVAGLPCYQADWIIRGPELDDGANCSSCEKTRSFDGTIRDSRQKSESVQCSALLRPDLPTLGDRQEDYHQQSEGRVHFFASRTQIHVQLIEAGRSRPIRHTPCPKDFSLKIFLGRRHMTRFDRTCLIALNPLVDEQRKARAWKLP